MHHRRPSQLRVERRIRREADYLASGDFDPPVNVITGIDIKAGAQANPEAVTVFLTVPRWFGGVPSTFIQT